MKGTDSKAGDIGSDARYEEMFKLFDHDKDGLLNRRDLMKAGACAEGTAMQVTPPDGIGSARQRARYTNSSLNLENCAFTSRKTDRRICRINCGSAIALRAGKRSSHDQKLSCG